MAIIFLNTPNQLPPPKKLIGNLPIRPTANKSLANRFPTVSVTFSRFGLNA